MNRVGRRGVLFKKEKKCSVPEIPVEEGVHVNGFLSIYTS